MWHSSIVEVLDDAEMKIHTALPQLLCWGMGAGSGTCALGAGSGTCALGAGSGTCALFLEVVWLLLSVRDGRFQKTLGREMMMLTSVTHLWTNAAEKYLHYLDKLCSVKSLLMGMYCAKELFTSLIVLIVKSTDMDLSESLMKQNKADVALAGPYENQNMLSNLARPYEDQNMLSNLEAEVVANEELSSEEKCSNEDQTFDVQSNADAELRAGDTDMGEHEKVYFEEQPHQCKGDTAVLQTYDSTSAAAMYRVTKQSNIHHVEIVDYPVEILQYQRYQMDHNARDGMSNVDSFTIKHWVERTPTLSLGNTIVLCSGIQLQTLASIPSEKGSKGRCCGKDSKYSGKDGANNQADGSTSSNGGSGHSSRSTNRSSGRRLSNGAAGDGDENGSRDQRRQNRHRDHCSNAAEQREKNASEQRDRSPLDGAGRDSGRSRSASCDGADLAAASSSEVHDSISSDGAGPSGSSSTPFSLQHTNIAEHQHSGSTSIANVDLNARELLKVNTGDIPSDPPIVDAVRLKERDDPQLPASQEPPERGDDKAVAGEQDLALFEDRPDPVLLLDVRPSSVCSTATTEGEMPYDGGTELALNWH